MEKELFRKIELEPLEKEGITRRRFLQILPPAIGGIFVGCYSFRFLSSPNQESSPVPEPTPTDSPTLIPTNTPEKPSPTNTPTPQPETPTPQESSTPTEIPEEKENRFLIGGINFADEESPIDIVYPRNFERTEMAKFENLKILVSDASGEKLKIFTTEFGGKVFVYSDIPSGTFVLNLHDGNLLSTGQPLEAEPLRELIERNLRNPYPLETIENNLERLISFPFFLTQGEQTSKFVITQAKRMNAMKVEEFRNRSGDLSLVLEPIKNPQNSFLLLTCSGRQPGEPEEIFPGRYVFVLEYAP